MLDVGWVERWLIRKWERTPRRLWHWDLVEFELWDILAAETASEIARDTVVRELIDENEDLSGFRSVSISTLIEEAAERVDARLFPNAKTNWIEEGF